jgi:hypothetical protein
MLDDYTRGRCKYAEMLSLRDGKDLFETLERAGLLVTMDRRLQIELDMLSVLLSQLESQEAFILAGFGGDQTVTGAVRGTIKFVELFQKTLRG